MLQRIVAWTAFAVWVRSLWRNSTWFASVTLGLCAVLVITFAHGEYLDLAAAAQSAQYVTWSFAAKWLLIAFTVLLVLWSIQRKRRRIASTSTPIASESNAADGENVSTPPQGVDLDRPRSAAERILNEPPR